MSTNGGRGYEGVQMTNAEGGVGHVGGYKERECLRRVYESGLFTVKCFCGGWRILARVCFWRKRIGWLDKLSLLGYCVGKGR